MSTPPIQNTTPQPASGAEHNRREQRRLLLFTALMLAFGAACWFAYPHFAKFTKQWLARRHLPELRQHLKDQNWQLAAASMRDARRWAQDDPEVIRACLEFNASIGGDPRSTISLIRQLQETGAATGDDLALMGQMHARLGEVSKARDIYDRLPAETRQNRHGLELHASLLRADGLHAEAFKAQREALLSSPEDPESMLQLAAMDLSSNDPSRRSAMRERLWQMARSGSPVSLAAIELLATSKELTVPQADELLQIVETTPAATARRESARLILLSTRMRLSPYLRADIIDQEITRWKDRPPAQTTPLVAWLAQEKEYARIMRMVPAQTAARYTDLLPSYVDALRGEEKWQDLNKLLTSGGIDSAFSAQKIRLWQVEVQIHLHADPAPARQTLMRIFEEAGRGDDLTTTLQAGTLAEKLNQWDLAQNCYQAIANKHSHTQEAMLAKVYQMAEYQHDSPGMLKICARLLALKPESTPLLGQKLYLQLLLGVDIEIAQQELSRWSKPDGVSRTDRQNLLLAFAAYRQGQSDVMRETVSHVSKPETLPAGERAVYAALLKQTGGDAGKVFRLIERISPALLLPEEKIFLQRAL